MPPFTQDTLGDTLKIVQIVFYVIGTILAILTYRAAKRGLLNTVNHYCPVNIRTNSVGYRS
jgi:hypothetical protein